MTTTLPGDQLDLQLLRNNGVPLGERMLHIITATHLTDNDINNVSVAGVNTQSGHYYLMAVLKNPRLTTSQLYYHPHFDFKGRNNLAVLNYYLDHANANPEIVHEAYNRLLADKGANSQTKFMNPDVYVAFLTSRHTSPKVRKGAIKSLAKNFAFCGFDRSDALTGTVDSEDPTAILYPAPKLTPTQIDQLFKLSMEKSDQYRFREQLLQHPRCPQTIRSRETVLEGGNLRYLDGLCRNPSLSEQDNTNLLAILREANHDQQRLMIRRLASNPSITFADYLHNKLAKAVELVASDEHNYDTFYISWFRDMVKNPALSTESFRTHILAADVEEVRYLGEEIYHDFRADDEVRAHLLAVHNKAGSVPPESWREKLNEDEQRQMFLNADPAYRVKVARHTTLPAIMAEAAKDPEYDVRESVARNKNAPLDLLESLTSDPESLVRRATVRDNLPVESLLELAADPSHDVRIAVAQVQNLSLDVVEKMLTDPNWNVRKYLAINNSATDETLQRILSDTRPEVRREAEAKLQNRKRLAELAARNTA